MKNLRVFLSPLAAQKLEGTWTYIECSWSEKVKDEFLERFKLKVVQISRFPESAQQSILEKGLFRAVVDQNTSFIYRRKEDSIEIITVFDNRQNPDEIESEIKEILVYYCVISSQNHPCGHSRAHKCTFFRRKRSEQFDWRKRICCSSPLHLRLIQRNPIRNGHLADNLA